MSLNVFTAEIFFFFISTLSLVSQFKVGEGGGGGGGGAQEFVNLFRFHAVN